jgi:hypothetical protein
MPPKETIDATPDPTLMDKVGQTGYSLSEMVAEIGDNSIDAAAEGQPVEIDVDLGETYIRITDNALGMTKAQLTDAVRLGKSSKKNKLGQYGLGLKAACVAMGSKFTIDTRPPNSPETFRVIWDSDEWAAKGNWTFDIETLPASPKASHGTVITVEKLKVRAGGKIATLRVDLGRRFAPFIRRGMATVRVDSKAVHAPKIDYLQDATLKVPNPGTFDITLTDGSRVHGSVGLMASSSQRGFYGFDTFRYGRMITTFDKFCFTHHPTLARIVGEIHMDNVPVTSNKREWIKESELYEEAVKKVRQAIAPYMAESRRLAQSKEVHETPADKAMKERVKEGLAQALGAPELKEYTLPEKKVSNPGDPTQVPDPKGHTTIEVPGREVRDPPKNPTGTQTPTGTGGQKNPKKVDLTKMRRLRIKGRIFDYQHTWRNLGPEARWTEYAWNEDERILEIDSNADHPSVLVSQDRNFLAFLHVVDAIAQIIMKESNAGWEKYDEIREVLVRETSKHLAELREPQVTA